MPGTDLDNFSVIAFDLTTRQRISNLARPLLSEVLVVNTSRAATGGIAYGDR